MKRPLVFIKIPAISKSPFDILYRPRWVNCRTKAIWRLHINKHTIFPLHICLNIFLLYPESNGVSIIDILQVKTINASKMRGGGGGGGAVIMITPDVKCTGVGNIVKWNPLLFLPEGCGIQCCYNVYNMVKINVINCNFCVANQINIRIRISFLRRINYWILLIIRRINVLM